MRKLAIVLGLATGLLLAGCAAPGSRMEQTTGLTFEERCMMYKATVDAYEKEGTITMWGQMVLSRARILVNGVCAPYLNRVPEPTVKPAPVE